MELERTFSQSNSLFYFRKMQATFSPTDVNGILDAVRNKLLGSPQATEAWSPAFTEAIATVADAVATAISLRPQIQTAAAIHNQQVIQNPVIYARNAEGVIEGDAALQFLVAQNAHLARIRREKFDDDTEVMMPTLVYRDIFYHSMPNYCKTMWEVRRFISVVGLDVKWF